MKDGVVITDLFDGRYIFGQTDSMIDIKGVVGLDVIEDLRLTKINKDCILLDLETIHL